MSVLRQMSEGEFEDFFRLAVNGYAADNASAGRWAAEEAHALAASETRALLPNGAGTLGHHLFVIHVASQDVGYLWFATIVRGIRKVAYLYQLLINEEFRRRGFGRVALEAFESEASRQGHDALSLNVFATNVGARRLYEAAGYREVSAVMGKALVH